MELGKRPEEVNHVPGLSEFFAEVQGEQGMLKDDARHLGGEMRLLKLKQVRKSPGEVILRDVVEGVVQSAENLVVGALVIEVAVRRDSDKDVEHSAEVFCRQFLVADHALELVHEGRVQLFRHGVFVDVRDLWEDLEEADHVGVLHSLLRQLVWPCWLDKARRYYPLDDLVVELARALASLGKGAQHLDQVMRYELANLRQHHSFESSEYLVCLFLTQYFTR